MREDSDIESSSSERSATARSKSHRGPYYDDISDNESAASVAETVMNKNEPLKDYDSDSEDDQSHRKRALNRRPSTRQFKKQLPRRQVRFMKSNSHLRGLVDIKLSPPKYQKFEAHYQKMLAQKQNLGSSAPEKYEFPAPKPSSEAPPMSSQSAEPQLLPSMPASPVFEKSRPHSQATLPKSKAESEVSVSMEPPPAFVRTNTSTTAATISSAWASTGSSSNISRAPSYTSTRAPSQTASRAPSRAASAVPSLTVPKAPSHMTSRAFCRTHSSVPSYTTSSASDTQKHNHDSFPATAATSSVKPTPSSPKSTSNTVDPVISHHPESVKTASMYKNPMHAKNPHEQSNKKGDKNGDKQHNVQVNKGASKPVDDHAGKPVNEHVDDKPGQHTKLRTNKLRTQQPDRQANASVSTTKDTTREEAAIMPGIASNADSETRTKQSSLQGLLPEIYDCMYKTRHCYACGRPRDMRYVDFRNKFLPGEEPQRSLCRSCRQCLDRNEELSLTPSSTNKRMLKDIKKFHWCAQCGTIRSQPFHKKYPSGTEVPPRHQLCHPCCKFAKLPLEIRSSYTSLKVDGHASNKSKKAGGDEESQTGNSLVSSTIRL